MNATSLRGWPLLMVAALAVATGCGQREAGRVEGERYVDRIFEQYDVIRDIIYATAETRAGHQRDLVLDIYQPRGDDATRRATVVLVHGGAFVKGGRQDMHRFARRLVRLGYTVANIKYRLDDLDRRPLSPIDVLDALIRARVDVHSAVAFLRQEAAAANRFGIDPQNISLWGASAGAMAVLHATYVNSWEEAGPAEMGVLARHRALPDEEESRLGVRAVVNMAGALLNAKSIEPDEPPLLSIHGRDDEVVPFEAGDLQLEDVLLPTPVQGSALLHRQAMEAGIPSELRAVDGARHADFLDRCPECIEAAVAFLASHSRDQAPSP